MKTLTIKEIDFLYKMLIKHGYMPKATSTEELPIYSNNKQNYKSKNQNHNKKKFVKFIDKNKPNLNNFDDPLWEDCEEINFLIFRVIMEKIQE